MGKIENIKKQLQELEELEDKISQKEQKLLKQLRKAEQEERDKKLEGKPQMFRVDFGGVDYYYVAATTKEEAVNTYIKTFDKLSKKEVEQHTETLGVQMLKHTCE